MSEYVPDSDRSLAAIAEALERIADAQEELVEVARKLAPVSCPWRWTGPTEPPASPPWQPWSGTGYPLYPPTTWIGIVPPATGSDGSHG